ncbi:NtaA/DmoA family FMN-dependent monooxygenase [Achromobacter sp. SIMBA_011]|uniref:NtaA/DmoA family FMN-dependent monooxygenase n=1 Tax=Achromobacter TaxID=222 RepID=UPI003557A296
MHSSPLCIGLSLAATWLSASAWRRSDSRVEQLCDLDFYRLIAQRAEAACLDFVFRPDALFLDLPALAQGPGFSSLDPALLLAALARDTRHIGLVTTAATSFNPPYVVARQLQSLDWISDGRAGWNIVTALDGSQNFGDAPLPPSAQRYRKALEFTEVVQALWRSYPQDAVLADRTSGRYADLARIGPIAHRGEYFSVQGPLNVPARAGGRIPLFQAGASDWGRDFAARVADAVFAATPDVACGQALRKDLRRRVAAYGRARDAIRVLPGLSLYLAPTRAQALALHEATHAGQDASRKRHYIGQALGLDVEHLDPAAPITARMLGQPQTGLRSPTHAQLLRRLIEREQPCLRELLARPEASASAHWTVVGTVDDAVDAIRQRAEAEAADGFIALPGGAMQSLDLFLEAVMPRLAALGLARRAYASTTFAGNLGLA